MTPLHLNIVSFSIPYPANYGGVIDVYHKLVALHKLGIHMHLHCFQYDRDQAAELEGLCETVSYYPRQQGFKEQLSLIPYIVKSRRSDSLMSKLKSNEFPILFEGLHSCYYLQDPAFISRIKVYRESNIEHHYYYHLAQSSNNWKEKAFFLLESAKLFLFQSKLKNASLMLAVSTSDTHYLKHRFPDSRIVYLPSFHGNAEVRSKAGRGDYVLYHGNLSVAENSRVAEFLTRVVFPGLGIPCVIAGLKPSPSLQRSAETTGIGLVANPSDDEMDELISNAQVNILFTHQATGLKLKLLNTLYKGRHVLVNAAMLEGTGLDSLCHQAEEPKSIRMKIKELMDTPFSETSINERSLLLKELYSDQANAVKLKELLFPGS